MTASHYPLLIPLAPLAASLIIAFLGRHIGWKVSRIGVAAQVVALAVSLKTLHEVISVGPVSVNLGLFPPPWDFGLYIDRLAAVMMVHISAIAIVIHLFSIRYMQQEHGYARYHALLSLAGFVLLSMVSSANVLMLFIFWQLLTWLVYLLSYHYSHPPTVEGAFKTFTVLRIGDIAFLAGIVLAQGLYGTLDFQQLFERAAQVPVTFALWPGSRFEIGGATVITLLIFVGAMSKSAQFPMHIWLPGSLYAPTPVHAILHAGIINAGGFLLNRLAPLYGLAPNTLHVAFVIGGLTAIVGAAIMLTQSDIKRMLGFSTIGQMGYMIMECGLGAFALAIFHLIAHGLFKATVFLNCSNVIHEARRDPHFPPGSLQEEAESSPNLPWATGVIMTLLLPLIILLTAHGIVQVPLRDAQGAVIFLFFAWVTSSQAILSLYRLRAVGSWKVASIMVFTIFVVMVTYLWAVETFTYFLYPTPGEAARYFEAAALPLWFFDLLIVMVTLLVIGGWVVVYRNVRGEHILVPQGILRLMPRLYLLFWNHLYIDMVYTRLGQALARLARRLDATLPGWLP
jgi:NADH-quinone oxidoreductase subunit L